MKCRACHQPTSNRRRSGYCAACRRAHCNRCDEVLPENRRQARCTDCEREQRQQWLNQPWRFCTHCRRHLPEGRRDPWCAVCRGDYNRRYRAKGRRDGLPARLPAPEECVDTL